MSQLLKLEFRKLFQMKSFYITTLISIALAVVSVLLTNLTANAMKQLAEAGDVTISVQTFAGIDSVYATQTSVANGMAVMLCGIFSAIFACEDFSSGTIKNIYSKGYSRTSIFFAKYIVSAIPAVLMVCLDMIASYVCGGLSNSFSSNLPENFVVGLVTQLCVVMAYQALFFAIAMMLTKLSASIVFVVVAPTVFSGLLSLADLALKQSSFSLSDYWLSSLLNSASSEPVRGIVMSVVYIAVFLMLGTFISNRKEV